MSKHFAADNVCCRARSGTKFSGIIISRKQVLDSEATCGRHGVERCGRRIGQTRCLKATPGGVFCKVGHSKILEMDDNNEKVWNRLFQSFGKFEGVCEDFSTKSFKISLSEPPSSSEGSELFAHEERRGCCSGRSNANSSPDHREAR